MVLGVIKHRLLSGKGILYLLIESKRVSRPRIFELDEGNVPLLLNTDAEVIVVNDQFNRLLVKF